MLSNDSGLTLTNLSVQSELTGNVGLTAASTTQGTATNGAQVASYFIRFFTNLTKVTLTYSGFPHGPRHLSPIPSRPASWALPSRWPPSPRRTSGQCAARDCFRRFPGCRGRDLVDFMLAVTNRGPDRAVDVEVLRPFLPG